MIKQAFKIALLLMVSLIGSGYANNRHLEIVKFKIVDEAAREPLKNCELNIYKFVYFKFKPGAQSLYLDKKADWYITSVVTDENGVFILDLSSIKETHIVVEPGKPYDGTRFSRTSDLAGTKSIDHIRVTNFRVGLASRRIYDLRNGMVKVIAASGKTVEEPFTEILLTVRKRENELYSEAEAVLLQFQQAIKESDYDKALRFCSEVVKSKVGDYGSAEAFFRSIVPVKEIASLTQFQTSGGMYNREKQRVNFRCFLRIPTAVSENENTVDWVWIVGKSDSGWVIDFEDMPLENWIEKEKSRRIRETKEATAKRDQMRKGFEIRLTALDKEFVIGQPMLFRVVMTNVSKSPIIYRGTSAVMVNNPMFVTGPNGNKIKFVGTDCQTVMREQEIMPGEQIILADKYDVAAQYRIIEPGRYTFQFAAFEPRGIRPSNIVEINVKAGESSLADKIAYKIIERLLLVLPEEWEFTRRVIPRKTLSENSSSQCIYVNLIGDRGQKAVNTGIQILIIISPTKDEIAVEPEWFINHLWGICKWGPVYVESFDADLLWPDYREKIINTLNIEERKSD